MARYYSRRYGEEVGYDKPQRFMDIDLIGFLGNIAEMAYKNNPECRESDKETLQNAAISNDPAARRLVWHVSNYGTRLFTEYDTFIEDTDAYRHLSKYGGHSGGASVYPLSSGLRDKINNAVLAEFEKQSSLSSDERGYEKPEPKESNINADEVDLNSRVFLTKDPGKGTLAFASVGIDEALVIRGIRIRDTDKGISVTMPQAEDKADKPYDVAFPLSGELRSKISKDVLSKYREHTAQRKQGIAERFAEGKVESVRLATAVPKRATAMAKSSPANASLGLGD